MNARDGMVRLSLAAGLASALLAVSAIPVLATDGAMIIYTDTTLTEDHHGSIVIAADDVTLDCAGHAVVGTGEWTGILLDGRSAVTVTNCTVTGFEYGIIVAAWAGPSSSNALLADTASANTRIGVLLLDTTASLITGSTARSNGESGFGVLGSWSNQVTDNTATGNGIDGFTLVAADDNYLANNVATANSVSSPGCGFVLDAGSNSNMLEHNVANRNHADGFRVQSSDGNTLRDNVANGNGTGAGFLVYLGSANVLAGNVANANSIAGFALDSTTGNTLSGNRSMNNGSVGLSLYLSDHNTLSENTAVGNESGIHMTLSDDNVLTVNIAFGNTFDGFVVASSSRNEFSGNRATMNRFGFWVRANLDLPDAMLNVFTGNTGCRNEYWDALDEGVDTAWVNNTFCTWSGF